MEQRNAEPVDRKRFQVRSAAITKLFQALVTSHLEPLIRFAIQQFLLRKLQSNPLVQKMSLTRVLA